MLAACGLERSPRSRDEEDPGDEAADPDRGGQAEPLAEDEDPDRDREERRRPRAIG
jgi:hypothetical protein